MAQLAEPSKENESNDLQSKVDSAVAQQEQQQKQNNQAEAIKFIKSKLDSAFDEKSAKQLFEYYTLDKNTQRLQPPDVRKLLLDILSASEWPLVVPDESLDAVLSELCLNDEGSISWIEFKSFFVFLQDKPIQKIFEIITKSFTQKQLSFARLITIKPVNKSNPKPIEEQKDEQKETSAATEQNYYDRNKWNNAVQSLCPQAKQIFVYFMDGYQIMAIAMGDFEEKLAEPAAAEVKLDDVVYLATIRAFDVEKDIFPPIARSGGMKSKVARRIADSYLIARKWDAKHLQLIDKASKVAAKVQIKWTEFDEKYKVNERAAAASNSVLNSVKAFDEKHQLTRRLSGTAKTLDERFGISAKLGSVATKISENEKVKSVSNKVVKGFNDAVQTMEDVTAETQQLVQEKRQKDQEKVAENDKDKEEEQEGDV